MFYLGTGHGFYRNQSFSLEKKVTLRKGVNDISLLSIMTGLPVNWLNSICIWFIIKSTGAIYDSFKVLKFAELFKAVILLLLFNFVNFCLRFFGLSVSFYKKWLGFSCLITLIQVHLNIFRVKNIIFYLYLCNGEN